MTKIVGLEDIKSGGELQEEIQGDREVTSEALASITSASQKPG